VKKASKSNAIATRARSTERLATDTRRPRLDRKAICAAKLSGKSSARSGCDTPVPAR
jgi:hypothetical protein